MYLNNYLNTPLMNNFMDLRQFLDLVQCYYYLNEQTLAIEYAWFELLSSLQAATTDRSLP